MVMSKADLEKSIGSVISGGEGQQVEFKAGVPQQWRDLAKEFAAFATSGGGTVLIGVSDQGVVLGVEGLSTLSEKDAMLRRIEGVCTSHIKPPITPSVQFMSHDQKLIIAINVPSLKRL